MEKQLFPLFDFVGKKAELAFDGVNCGAQFLANSNYIRSSISGIYLKLNLVASWNRKKNCKNCSGWKRFLGSPWRSSRLFSSPTMPNSYSSEFSSGDSVRILIRPEYSGWSGLTDLRGRITTPSSISSWTAGNSIEPIGAKTAIKFTLVWLRLPTFRNYFHVFCCRARARIPAASQVILHFLAQLQGAWVSFKVTKNHFF